MKSLSGIILLLVCSLPLYIFGQSTITYFKGPSFAATGEARLDINADGIPDFTFSSEAPVCTASIPPICIFPYFISGGTNELLGSDYAASLPFGAPIGNSAEGETWTTGTELTVYYTGWAFPARTPDPYWLGGLGFGMGYLGVRFHSADGLHYGWIRVRLPASFPNQTVTEFSPVVMEWAYETRPNTPIHAGDTGESRTEFTVKFLYGNAIIQGGDYSTGRIWVGKDSLSYEIYLAGTGAPTGLTIQSSQPNRKPLANIDYPYITVHMPTIVYSDFTILFGEVNLPLGQAIQLSRGRYYLKRDDWGVIAEILPALP
jgi:hypothetical protein